MKRAEQPGTFRFTVLDNGVTSNEFWRSALFITSASPNFVLKFCHTCLCQSVPIVWKSFLGIEQRYQLDPVNILTSVWAMAQVILSAHYGLYDYS